MESILKYFTLKMARPKGIPSHKKGKVYVPKVSKNCSNCNNIFISYSSNHRKFCSFKCSGLYVTNKKRPEHSKTLIKLHKLKEFGYKKGEYSGDKNPAWKGGVTFTTRLIRKSRLYRVWRKKVLERDNYECTKCSSKDNLHVDHINPFVPYPELRFEVSNGRVLCFDCHKKTDTYGNKMVVRK